MPPLAKGEMMKAGMRLLRAPAVGLRRRDMIPEAAILVISDDDEHMAPLRALLESLQQIGGVGVAGRHVAGAGVLVDAAPGLVEGDLRQRALGDVGEEVVEILNVPGAIGYLRIGDVDPTVKVVRIDEVLPEDKGYKLRVQPEPVSGN